MLPYSQFTHTSLYGPTGYYSAPRTRVGRMPGADFFTASSIPLFSKLLSAAFTTLAQLHRLPPTTTLVEVGCEPSAALLPPEHLHAYTSNLPQPASAFANSLAFPLGTTPALPAHTLLFSNELLDAQPFERLRLQTDGWHLLGLDPAAGLLDLDLGLAPDSLTALLPFKRPASSLDSSTSPTASALPLSADHTFDLGHIIDLPSGALTLIDQLCTPAWSGLFIAFDYGFTTAQLAERPAGTARAYHNHKVLSLAEALRLPTGSYDITHHVAWDLVSDSLRTHGFSTPQLLSQESFLIHHAAHILPSLTSAERRQLSTLTHPSSMGQAFQVMIAHR